MSDAIQEQTLFRGSSSPLIKLGTFVFGGLVAAAALVFAFVVPAPYSFGLFGLAVLALGYVVIQYLFVKVRTYEVTTERVRITTGIVTRRTDELELYRVKDTTLIEPLSLRMF